MQKIMLAAIMLSILASFSFACQEAFATVPVPAVVSGQEGGLLNVSVHTLPGSGKVFTQISPAVGISTQLSQEEAVRQAFLLSGGEREKCDVYFSFFDDGNTPAVDGPSAGVAMAVALTAALEAKELRHDVAITGEILPGGMAGAVGGIIDKAQASARSGMHIIITPKQQIYDNILLSKLGEKYDIAPFEAKTLKEAYDVATSKEGEKFSQKFELEAKEIAPNLPRREMNLLDTKFAEVAKGINSQLYAKIIMQREGALAEYASYFEQEFEKNGKIIDMGYAYTAANNAFLSQIDAAFLSIPPQKLDLQKEILDVEGCLASQPEVEPTEKNFEWVAGADARVAWAEEKLDEIKKIENGLDSQEGKYLALREVYYAKGWCEAAYYIKRQAKEERGERINQSALAPLAQDMLEQAQKEIGNSFLPDADAMHHLSLANSSMQKGKYLAAIYDISYARGTQESESAKDLPDIENYTKALMKEEFSTLWGRTYQSQGIYGAYSASGENRSISEGYGVLSLGASMEEGMLRVAQRISSSPISVQVEERGIMENKLANIFVGGIFFVCIIFLGVKISELGGRKGI